jgi:hypothetical protein
VNGISTSKMVHLFESVAAKLEADSGGPVHLIRIIGPRSSFVAGHVPGNMPFVASVRVMLNEEWALLFYPAPGREVDREKVKVLFKGVL